MPSAWGKAWGSAWGAAFGDVSAAPAIITGSGAVEQQAGQVSGTGYIPGGAVQAVAPDLYPGGVPSTTLLRESAERNGFILTGDGQAGQAPGEAHGGARIKRVSLVATAASVAHGAGEVAATAEFRDIELEMVAMLLAA